ncbi:Fe-S cluster assembly protein SufD [Longibacter salinarum]|uniref:Fe-S cluster assembly protein SufD n=1 Tax=Longibacter salinarum TaxID=1850348 RepID=A0A2A8CZX8_9BACT|nr:Fe-S cluster assembly protein SufD [Longibacter salinarum]PEN13958.1 Fe-S cluster assembly protein SufD [Longibacter salinarum]
MPTTLDTSAPAKDRFLSAFEMSSGQALNGKNASISSHREAAIERFAELGVPTNKLEAWKYTDISKIVDREYTLPLSMNVPDVDPSDLNDVLIDDLDAHRIVLVNGRVHEGLSDIGTLPDGVVVSSLADAGANHPDIVEAHYGEYADFEDEALTALNTAFVQDGLFVYVPSGTIVEKPIYAVHLTVADDDVMIQPRHLFVVEDGGIATIIEMQHTLTDARVFTNTVREAYVGARGNLDHYIGQVESDASSQVQTTAAYHEDNSVFSTNTITLSGEVVRNNLTITPDGEFCESNLYGLYLGKDSMHVDNQTLVDHVHADCVSNELYKNVLNDASKGVFNGKVFVRPDSQRINAYQSNKSIVLSNEANMYTKPELEIYADDVQCSHGATSGQLDEEGIFYLRSRGLSEKRARILMLQAFAQDIVDEIRVDALREHMTERVQERFASYFDRS